jgi:formate hydrogenlyase subunit 5
VENKPSIIEVLEKSFKGNLYQIQKEICGTATIQVDADKHKDAIRVMLDADKKTALTAITGIDLGANIGVLYHIRLSDGFVTVRAELPKENAKIATITDLIPGAAFHEREVTDLLGVYVEGHPSPGRLLLSENWPENVFPLRKDVNANEVKLVPAPPSEANVPPEDQRLVKIIVGPQHPALCEPEKFAIIASGETVTGIQPRIGYVHRGIEKASESRTYLQDVYLVERICGICNACHSYGFVGATEKLLKAEVPERAKYIRVITLELNRLHSHLLSLGHTALEIGYETIFQYFWRDREPIMDMIELTGGNRVYASLMTIGGVRRDIYDYDIPKIKAVMADLRKRLPFYKQIYANEPSLKLRMKGVGTLTREDAIKQCVVGPVARASGYDIDVRKDAPYEVYGDIPFKEIVYAEGDTWARMNVRMDEIEESIDIIEYALDHMPSGPFRIDLPRSVPEGEAIHRLEAPRGELFYYVKSNGTDKPDRVKVRTPTFANLPAFLNTIVGENIADVPANLASLDPCFSCTDR